jgi:hypothetical protein
MGHRVKVEYDHTRTLGEWLIHIHEDKPSGPTTDAVRLELERHGVKVDGSTVKVANATPGIKVIYAGTPVGPTVRTNASYGAYRLPGLEVTPGSLATRANARPFPGTQLCPSRNDGQFRPNCPDRPATVPATPIEFLRLGTDGTVRTGK